MAKQFDEDDDDDEDDQDDDDVNANKSFDELYDNPPPSSKYEWKNSTVNLTIKNMGNRIDLILVFVSPRLRRGGQGGMISARVEFYETINFVIRTSR